MSKKKYIRRGQSIINIYEDYHYYLAQENIYSMLWGDRPTGYRKAAYIWKALLKEYGYK